MRVSLAWIGIILVTLVLVGFASQAYLLYTESKDESNTEGFSDLDIALTSCPAETVSYVDMNGMSLCCKTPLVNGTCPSGQLACTLSGGSSIPTCSAYLAAMLEEKGKERCPPSRPNYYENGLVRGCTAGLRNAGGTAPRNPADPTCVLYTHEDDDLAKLDSCTNLRLLEKTKCFDGIKATPTLQQTGAGIALVNCSYTDPSTHMPASCFSDESMYRFSTYLVSKGWWPKDWKPLWSPYSKVQWCSKHRKVYIDKSMKIEDLARDPI